MPTAWFVPPIAALAIVLPIVPTALAQNLGADRRGIAFAHDLVSHTPDGALVLVTGDLNVQAANYICAVERSCGGRVFLAPGDLFLPWRLAQLRRRHPGLASELPSDPGMKNVHELVARELDTALRLRHAGFLQRDVALTHYALAPDMLLVRLYGSEEAARDDRARIAARARAMADGEDCEGCALYARSGFQPEEEILLRLAYGAAYANATVAARTLLADPALAAALEARAVEFARAAP